MIFDQYSRYRAVALSCEIILQSLPSGLTSTIIDVGSGPYKLLGNFLNKSTITYFDPLLAGQVATNSKETLVSKSIFDTDLDLLTLKSDIVVSIDTLEHIAPGSRLDFLERLFSLSNNSFVLSFPCNDTNESTDVDLFVNDFFKTTFGEDYSWLSEHFEYGLPSAEETASFFNQKGLKTQTFRQGNCDWLKEILPLVLALNEFDFLSDEVEIQSDFFNKFLAPFDIGYKGYRTILIASQREIDLDKIITRNFPLESDLNQRVSKIKSDLLVNSFYPALAKLREMRKEILDLQIKNVEIGEWGLLLQSRLKDSEERQKSSNEVNS